MRKSPQESATIFKLSTIKEGLDGFYYYVLKDKNKICKKCSAITIQN